jgi:hypothetical protein
MNTEQASRLNEIINNDCEYQGRYFYRGKACIIGAMIQSIGLKPKRPPAWNYDTVYNLPTRITNSLCESFGLTLEDLSEFININDSPSTIEVRRMELCREVERILAGGE